MLIQRNGRGVSPHHVRCRFEFSTQTNKVSIFIGLISTYLIIRASERIACKIEECTHHFSCTNTFDPLSIKICILWLSWVCACPSYYSVTLLQEMNEMIGRIHTDRMMEVVQNVLNYRKDEIIHNDSVLHLHLASSMLLL